MLPDTNNDERNIDHDTFHRLIQDKGTALSEGRPVPNGWYYDIDGKRVYKDIYVLAKMLLDKLSTGNFVNLPKNRTVCRRGVAKALLARRKEVSRLDDEGKTVTYFHLDQSVMNSFICSRWSPSSSASIDPSANDRVRLIGILLDEEHSLYYDIILGNHHCSGNRQDVDNPAMRLKEAWATVSIAYNNNNYVVANPRMWYTACEKDGYDLINPNDPTRFSITRDGKWLSKLYKTTISMYRVSFEKYTKGTGGGPGDPADYSDWENRHDIMFDRYTSDGKLYLTWLYMRDKEVGFKLCAKYDDVPNGVDGRNLVAVGTSPNDGRSLKKKSSANSNINAAMEETFKEMNTAIKAAADSFSISSIDSSQRLGNTLVQNELADMEKIVKQLETLLNLKRVYEQMPEDTDEQRRAKKLRIDSVSKSEEKLCKMLDSNTADND